MKKLALATAVAAALTVSAAPSDARGGRGFSVARPLMRPTARVKVPVPAPKPAPAARAAKAPTRSTPPAAESSGGFLEGAAGAAVGTVAAGVLMNGAAAPDQAEKPAPDERPAEEHKTQWPWPFNLFL